MPLTRNDLESPGNGGGFMLSSEPEAQLVPDRPSLVICDGHLLVAHGLAQALGADYDIKAVFQSGRALEDFILTTPIDLVITEIDLLDQSGLDVLKRARLRGVKVPFIFCTLHANPVIVQHAFYGGARGVISKLEGVVALRSAIELGLRGKAYLSSSFLTMLLRELEMPVIKLTSKQRRILELIAQGLRAQQIADQLGLSRRTIESHKRKLMILLDTHSPQELLVRARSLGLLATAGLHSGLST